MAALLVREACLMYLSPVAWARLYAGLSQAELAEAVGASRATISSIERGLSIPAVTLAISIARRLDADVEALFAADALR